MRAAGTARGPAGEVGLLLLATAFLTQLPVPSRVHALGDRLGSAVGYFPVVGTLLGIIVAGLDLLLGLLVPRPVVSALDIAAFALLTGAFHLDGLMDACDGLWGGRTAERRLEIMRDSRVGSFGVVGGALVLLVQYSALSTLGGVARTSALVLAPTLARWVVAVGIWRFPYVRSEGRGAVLKEGLHPGRVLLATTWTAALALLLVESRALWLLPAAALLLLGVGRWIRGRLGGGLTGDAYGALNELTATLTLVALSA